MLDKWMANHSNKLLYGIFCGAYILGIIFIIIIVFCFDESKLREESITKNRPEKIQEIKDTYEKISGIAKEEVTNPIENRSLYIESIEEQNEKIISNRDSLSDIVLNISSMYNIRPELIMAMIEVESTYNAEATNGNCIGLMQVNKIVHAERAEKLGVEDLYNPYGNILVGTDYLSELLKQHDGNEGKALVAYNTGHYIGGITPYAIDVLNRSYELLIE